MKSCSRNPLIQRCHVIQLRTPLSMKGTMTSFIWSHAWSSALGRFGGPSLRDIASTVHAWNLLMNIPKYAMNILGLSRPPSGSSKFKFPERELMTHDFHLCCQRGMIYSKCLSSANSQVQQTAEQLILYLQVMQPRSASKHTRYFVLEPSSQVYNTMDNRHYLTGR